jgi:integrase
MTEHVERLPARYNTSRNASWALSKVRDYFGERPISSIRTSDLQHFVTSLDLQPRSVATVWQHLRSTLRAAHLDGVIGRDPATAVRLPKPAKERLVVPTVEEVYALRAHAPAGFEVAIILGAGLGLRASEAAGLTVDRVDWLRREVLVDRQWHGRLDRFEPVKSEDGLRTIPASDVVLEQLAHHVEVHGIGAHGVLLHADGRPLNANRFGHRFKQTAAGAELDVTSHDLRHAYVSTLISAGCSIVAIQRAVGHSTPAITLNVYGHLMPDDLGRLRNAVDRAWCGPAESSVSPETSGHSL